MKIEFTKMHGIANDYIYINCMDLTELPFDPSELARQMSPRHFSVGADGVVLICASARADARMRMFNADGSEGKMCGNAIRCVGKYLWDNGICRRDKMDIETLSGIKHLCVEHDGTEVTRVRVDMGNASFAPGDIPVTRAGEMIREPLTVCGSEWELTAVSMGNPHAVCFTKDTDMLPLEKIGTHFENLDIFPERVNTEFAEILSPTHIKMRVWERGSGETWACGTGACATVAAAVKCGISPAGEPVAVELRGGTLTVECTPDYRIYMTGPAQKVYDGVYDYGRN